MPGTWFYSLKNCICLGLEEGYGFSAFAHDELRDTELDLSNSPQRELLNATLYSHGAWSQKIKPCLPASLCGKENSDFQKKEEY